MSPHEGGFLGGDGRRFRAQGLLSSVIAAVSRIARFLLVRGAALLLVILLFLAGTEDGTNPSPLDGLTSHEDMVAFVFPARAVEHTRDQK